jgi:hypothetical protein
MMDKELKGIFTDELLDHRAEQFRFYSVRDFLGITFEQFLEDPESYLDKVCMLVSVVIRERRFLEWQSDRFAKGLHPRRGIDLALPLHLCGEGTYHGSQC